MTDGIAVAAVAAVLLYVLVDCLLEQHTSERALLWLRRWWFLVYTFVHEFPCSKRCWRHGVTKFHHIGSRSLARGWHCWMCLEAERTKRPRDIEAWRRELWP